ncbi:hypothetical protein B296_00044631 [Ensete ventricosum]|uniref:Uncharacterized protein n=1 Tax=Ensete ventricosum TaxID=4639 RepID=A0A426YB65_ENSVE|nr:hypothetical protein B296_00044631 [Ensete ventricosum]
MSFFWQVSYGTFVAGFVGLPYQTKAFREMNIISSGGRTLQMKRGSVEGLNPLMFMFAVAANATYVGSILVRSVEWERVGANAPWLLDAIVCILLDLLIMMQFGYYKFLRGGEACTEDEHDDFTH